MSTETQKGPISERDVELLKRQAKKLKKELGCSHASALDRVSRLKNYADWIDLCKHRTMMGEDADAGTKPRVSTSHLAKTNASKSGGVEVGLTQSRSAKPGTTQSKATESRSADSKATQSRRTESKATQSGLTESLGDDDVDFTAKDEAFLRGEVAFTSSPIKGPTGFVRRRF